jgi:hypothetical protein
MNAVRRFHRRAENVAILDEWSHPQELSPEIVRNGYE